LCQQVARLADAGSQGRGAHRRHRLVAERQNDDPRVAAAPVLLGPGRAVDDVDVVFVRAEGRVVHAGRDPHFQPHRVGEQARQPRHQPLRGEARGAVQPQQHAVAPGHRGHTAFQLVKPLLHVPQQNLALAGQSDPAPLAEEQRGLQRVFQPADRVADGARGHAHQFGGGPEGSGPRRGFEGPERAEGKLLHGGQW
jgi:hypothetical protein